MDADVVVVGGGPAGLAAATWLARYRRTVLILDSREYRNRWVDATHGYLSRNLVRPFELLQRGREELLTYPGVQFRQAKAVSAQRAQNGQEFLFTVELEGGERLQSKRLVLATGVRDVFPDVAGFFDHYGADVFHCPTCDGYEAKGRHVVAFGWDARVASLALGLQHWAITVTVVTDGRPFAGEASHRGALAKAGIAVLEDEAVELVGPRGQLRAVRLRRVGEIPCSMAFFSIAHSPRTDLAGQLGCDLSKDGYVIVDDQGQTSVPGVYAAGDLVPGLQLVQVAAGKGAVAGVGCALSF